MAIPDRSKIKSALVSYLNNYGGTSRSLRPIEVYDGLAKILDLTVEDLAKQRSWEAYWPNEVRWARQELVAEGYLVPPNQSGHGIWKLVDGVNSYESTSETKTSFQKIYIKDHDSSLELSELDADLEAEGLFKPTGLADARDIILRVIVQRRGQHRFRESLLNAYESRCAITQENTMAALEAAHIVPYLGEHTNVVQNGLLLRSDIHTLFDLHLLSINPSKLEVEISPELAFTGYAKYRNQRLHLPKKLSDYPSKEALEKHREQCGF